MVIDIFCPDLNVQAALSFMATMWMVSLTRVNSDDVKEYYYAPLAYGSASSGCKMTLQAYPNVADGKALYITMATRYNETYTDDTNLTLDSSKMYKSSIISHVHQFTSDARPNMQILSDKGDPMYIPSSHQQATDYLLLLDDASQHGGQAVYVVGMNDNTTVNVYMNTNVSSHASTEMVASMQINNYDTVLLNSTYTVDGVRLNSSLCFGIVVMSGDVWNQCNFSTDSTWERLPSTTFMGREFHIMSPSNQTVHICKFIGSQRGNLSIYKDGNSTVYDTLPYTSLTVNLTGQPEVVVSSAEPIQTLCTTWVQQQTSHEQQVYRNQYLPLPVDLMSGCNVAIVQNCENKTCILAMSASTTEALDIRQSSEKSKSTVLCVRTSVLGDRKYQIWDLWNLTDGVYVLETQDSAPLMVFILDLFSGRFFPLERSTCNASIDSQSIQGTSGNKPVSNAAIHSAQSLAANVTGEPSVSLLSNTTEVNSNGTSNSSSINTTPVASTVKTTTKHVVVVSQYSFMYDGVSDDDRILNEYMIAVIVSLGTAIFAVIAFLSTFLLLEVLSRRRQLGNSKIRPMVS
ncbi:uncharacterized protein LOC110458173 [Mizuhopecten yessoensis]|uniref:Uncharacterized protein n=1 Tax=Mizuhopecten yessoensis TaxID=6573 RepID=A0A210Q768_MIZYE|nr:uncharacterized protein LOC110458173 [Mizuhopecten yessoensis]OWF44580.1 hypothetical protein KP79_PYT17911 [Mizuhopecten yessoensis]